jgi:hypothetical protein
VDLLQTTLCLPTCPEQLQVLCAAILREMSPSDSLSLSCDLAQNTRQLSLVASVLLAQVMPSSVLAGVLGPGGAWEAGLPPGLCLTHCVDPPHVDGVQEPWHLVASRTRPCCLLLPAPHLPGEVATRGCVEDCQASTPGFSDSKRHAVSGPGTGGRPWLGADRLSGSGSLPETIPGRSVAVSQKDKGSPAIGDQESLRSTSLSTQVLPATVTFAAVTVRSSVRHLRPPHNCPVC